MFNYYGLLLLHLFKPFNLTILFYDLFYLNLITLYVKYVRNFEFFTKCLAGCCNPLYFMFRLWEITFFPIELTGGIRHTSWVHIQYNAIFLAYIDQRKNPYFTQLIWVFV